MKKIYLVLTKSPTVLSRTINFITHEPYTHASISFSNTTQPMYSAGRDYARLPFPGHMKSEPLDSGFYKCFPNCKVGVYSLEVSDENFQKAYDFVMDGVNRRLPFNVLGLLLCQFNIDHPRKDRYFCSEFVANALVKANVDILKKPNLYHPSDFLKIEGLKCLYTGLIKDLIGMSFQ